MRRSRLYERLADLSGVISGAVPGMPLIEIISDKRVLIENHKGVCKYTRDQICVKCNFGIIKVSGTDLHIKNMSADQLMILGSIGCITMCRRT